MSPSKTRADIVLWTGPTQLRPEMLNTVNSYTATQAPSPLYSILHILIPFTSPNSTTYNFGRTMDYNADRFAAVSKPRRPYPVTPMQMPPARLFAAAPKCRIVEESFVDVLSFCCLHSQSLWEEERGLYTHRHGGSVAAVSAKTKRSSLLLRPVLLLLLLGRRHEPACKRGLHAVHSLLLCLLL